MYGTSPGQGPEHMFWIDGKAYPQDRTVRKGGSAWQTTRAPEPRLAAPPGAGRRIAPVADPAPGWSRSGAATCNPAGPASCPAPAGTEAMHRRWSACYSKR